jgi:hypothetical protein
MIPILKDCGCVTHSGPCEDHQRQMLKASRMASYARIEHEAAQPGYSQSAFLQAQVLVQYNLAEAARDLAKHIRWMHRLGVAVFCRTCWQGFAASDLPAQCACGGTLPTQPAIDMLAMAARMDVRGKWPPVEGP